MIVRDLIHAVDPYNDLDVSGHVLDLQGWGSKDQIFRDAITEVRPSLILEVGTWKGASAIHMATIAQELGLPDVEICCVDTWLGALEFWFDHKDPDRYKSLQLINGFPSVYYTFLKNVAALGHGSTITPFPTTSAIAARFFVERGVTFDLIYIDASHDYEDVRDDILSYWPLVKPGGMLIGDDYGGWWKGVTRAVDEFGETRQTEIRGHGKWLARRPT